MQLNTDIIKKLVLKDWDLYQKAIAFYLGGGILGLAIFGTPYLATFYMGALTLLTLLVAAGFMILFGTTINEKKEQTVPFIMSLPVKPIEFSIAKIIANLSIFLVMWVAIVAGFTFVTVFSPIPNGLLVFFWLISITLILNYVIVLAVAMISESEGWTIFAVVIVNLALNPVIMLLARNPEFHQYFPEERVVWTSTGYAVLGAQICLTLLILFMTVAHQARRRTFI